MSLRLRLLLFIAAVNVGVLLLVVWLGTRAAWTVEPVAARSLVEALRVAESEELPAGLPRRLRLECWDTHVSLGWLDEARSDREIWQRRFADSEIPKQALTTPDTCAPLSPDEERARAQVSKEKN